MDIKNELERILGSGQVLIDEPMKNHTSFKIGGPADFLVIPNSKEELVDLIKFLRKKNIKYYLIGNGSNLLVSDKGIRGVVIKTTSLNKVEVIGERVISEAGASLAKVSAEALRNSLKGMEFASGIPGSIGGAVFMNAGAYCGEMKDIVERVMVLDREGNVRNLKNEELEFAYRFSNVQKNEYIVLEVELKLEKGNFDEIKALMEDLNRKRAEKQPLNYPSAGSVFKRPEGYYAGKLIEDAGLKGAKVGGAMVSEKHAGFIINFDNATCEDVLNLIKLIQTKVYEKFGVMLETEVKYLGE
ncbi:MULTISPECIES: UDP-N-acetylmuramate dehydrogenase [Caloramator]|uniref:UDP-N-acetylenolpyruvoylglucosamine reductase n=1 Tax=Caloramator australicus RC3 TaxID=857293 RepID=I7KUG1_9CLOT|nr:MULTISPECIES: UDP-N-acetylmuramate dehydrogenase [Caloramator]MDO6355214.1 UDP-N-acetylmuramate dehydrogenase [Caloramator sp. CAR-1]CCJ33558.1 UDP-N-acetylenolpyruvoylglucosamine reductase [Caloramator australicus RC3]